MNAGALLNEAEKILLAEHHATLETAGDGQFEDALAQAVMREIAPGWTRTQRARTEGRRAVYLSAEYLIGRLLENNLLSLGALEDVRAELKKRGADEKLLALEDREEPALGNGGLGRLASCYLDSAAAQNIPLDGYGLRYRFGLFRQTIDEEGQHEHPDDWARAGDPWSIRREELAVTVPLRGENVTAVPYDMPVVGYRSGSVGTLRLWQTESETNLDLAAFHAQRYAQAAAARQRAETITSVLYPCDSGFAGQKLRAVQEYVLCSASMQDMLRAFEKANGDGDWSRFAALNAVQSVISPKSGHINQHEAGSVENAGHKILELETSDGKISAAQIRECAAEYYESGEPEHLTEPKLVYISFPTEFGSLYSKQELQEIHEVCRTYGMYLFIDGARLGYGLGSCVNDVTPQDLAAFADVFYLGGTKCGAMFGEAVVILNDRLKKRFRSYMKQNGAVLAKGWLLGFQFYMLLKDGAYFEITRQADAQAMRIKEAFAQKDIPSYVESFTNQQFVIVTPQQEAKLAAKYIYEPSGSLPDGRSIIRF